MNSVYKGHGVHENTGWIGGRVNVLVYSEASAQDRVESGGWQNLMLDGSGENKLCKTFKAGISKNESLVPSYVSQWCNKNGLCVHKQYKR